MRKRRLEAWQWRDGGYLPLPVDMNGVLRSTVFPGLALAGEALWAGDLAVLQAELAKPERTAFVVNKRCWAVLLTNGARFC